MADVSFKRDQLTKERNRLRDLEKPHSTACTGYWKKPIIVLCFSRFSELHNIRAAYYPRDMPMYCYLTVIEVH
jgi:hypothetical protein